MVILSGNKFSLTLRPPIWRTRPFYFSDATSVACRWPSQNDGAGLNAVQFPKLETTSDLNVFGFHISERQLSFPELFRGSWSVSACNQKVFFDSHFISGIN